MRFQGLRLCVKMYIPGLVLRTFARHRVDHSARCAYVLPTSPPCVKMQKRPIQICMRRKMNLPENAMLLSSSY